MSRSLSHTAISADRAIALPAGPLLACPQDPRPKQLTGCPWRKRFVPLGWGRSRLRDVVPQVRETDGGRAALTVTIKGGQADQARVPEGSAGILGHLPGTSGSCWAPVPPCDNLRGIQIAAVASP